MLNIDYYKQNSEYLDLSKYKILFEKLWSTMKTKFRKLEALQFYDEGNESAYLDFINENIDGFSKKLRKNKISESSYYIDALSKGVDLKRLHFINYPINKYLQYEYYSYYITSTLGEQIRYIKQKDFTKYDILDFVMFDDTNLLLLDYDNNGRLCGAWNIKDNISLILPQVSKWFDNNFKHSNNFQSIMLPDAKILKMIL